VNRVGMSFDSIMVPIPSSPWPGFPLGTALS